MMRKQLWLMAVLMVTTLAGAAAQQAAPKPEPEPEPSSAHFYRVEYTVFELADGKRANARSYSVVVQEGRNPKPGQIRLGSRIPLPVAGDKGGVHYMDVGARIDSRVREVKDALELDTTMEITSLSGARGETDVPPPSTPVVRRMEYAGSSVLPVGKPVLLSSMDDVNSGRRIQVEVTVTRLR
jgi:hypothetical protein